MSATTVDVRLPTFTVPQDQIYNLDLAPERCIDVEGAPRSAKSWGAAFFIWKLARDYPGIQVFYCRYKDEGLTQLRDVWNKVAVNHPPYMHATWNSQDQAWDFPGGEWVGEVYTGSRVFLSSLRVAEAQTTDAVHGKYKGKTLAVVVIEEAQEVPRINYLGLKERLSQSRTPLGQAFRYPLKIVLVHNAVSEDHWIAEEFPLVGDRCLKPDHLHIRADLLSNRHNLGEHVIAGYETDHPDGDPQRLTIIEGRRGLTQVGKPVYEGYFDRLIHVSTSVARNPHYPILVGWDFGQEKPAVVFAQFVGQSGALQILGSIKGKRIFLEDFAPKVLEIQHRWFPQPAQFFTWTDPTGATGNQGTRHTAVRLLRDLGVSDARYEVNANDATVRYSAIQTLAGFMRRKARGGSPAFMMHPRCIELELVNGSVTEQETDLMVRAFAAGYVWGEKAASDAEPNIRKPQKGTRYDDLMNALEYCITGEQLSVPTEAQMLREHDRMLIRAQRQAVALEQQIADIGATGPTGETWLQARERVRLANKANRDYDPSDRLRGKRGPSGGGYSPFGGRR